MSQQAPAASRDLVNDASLAGGNVSPEQRHIPVPFSSGACPSLARVKASHIRLHPLLPALADCIATGKPQDAVGAGDLAEEVQEAADAYCRLYRTHGAAEPWIGYLARAGEQGSIVGVCGFKSPPRDGSVEIAFLTVSDFERQGFGSAMAAALLRLAAAHRSVEKVVAHTLREANPSTRILRKLGFRRVGVTEDPEAGAVWQWELSLRQD